MRVSLGIGPFRFYSDGRRRRARLSSHDRLVKNVGQIERMQQATINARTRRAQRARRAGQIDHAERIERRTQNIQAGHVEQLRRVVARSVKR